MTLNDTCSAVKQSEVEKEISLLKKALNSIAENLQSHSDRLVSIKSPAGLKGDISNEKNCPECMLSPLGETIRSLRNCAEGLVQKSNEISENLAI